MNGVQEAGSSNLLTQIKEPVSEGACRLFIYLIASVSALFLEHILGAMMRLHQLSVFSAFDIPAYPVGNLLATGISDQRQNNGLKSKETDKRVCQNSHNCDAFKDI